MFDLTLQLVLFRLIALLIIATASGAAQAAAAVLLGDDGPRHDGRLSLNPLVHLDAVGGIGLVFFGIGFAKPVAVETARLRQGRWGHVIIALAGLVAVIVLAAVLQLLRRPALSLFPGNFGLSTVAFLDIAAQVSLWFAALNVLPVPPLTGGHFLRAAWPAAAAWLARYRVAVLVVLLAFIASGLAEQFLAPLYAALAHLVLSSR